jgi:hypothetical protein
MDVKKKLMDYFEFMQSEWEKEYKNSKDDLSKKQTGEKVSMYNSLKFTIEWLLLDSREQHSRRIEWLSVMRKRGWDMSTQEKIIELYEKIDNSLPYLIVLNRDNQINTLVDLCYAIMNKIIYQMQFLKEFTHAEIDLFTAKIELDQIVDEGLHPECEQKALDLLNYLENYFKQ